MSERRKANRHAVDVFFNKFLDGHPYLCRAVDISTTGLSFEVFTEPSTRHEAFPMELRLPGGERSLWVWARKVRVEGTREAIRFESLHHDDRALLDHYLEAVAA